MIPTSILLLLLVLPFSHAAYQCVRDEDCSLNGRCAPSSRTCVCDKGWIGDDCGALDLLPATRMTGYNRTSEGISSWGGKIVQDPTDLTLYHLFAAEFTHNCSLDYWSPFSRIIRAVSNNAEGPYHLASEIVGTFAHNPTVIYSDAYKLWVMVHIGCTQNVPNVCKNLEITCDAGNTVNGESGITLRVASRLDGDWKNLGIVFGANTPGTWDRDTTNPSLFPLSDGSVVLAYRGCPYQCDGAELINIAFARNLTGPYKRLQASPIFPASNEDPFIWQDARGYWHMLLHSLEPHGGFGGGPNVGRHAFALTYEGPWTFWNRTLAFTTSASFTDGTKIEFFRRERPQLFFDGSGRMKYLISGVQQNGNNAASYTFIQPING